MGMHLCSFTPVALLLLPFTGSPEECPIASSAKPSTTTALKVSTVAYFLCPLWPACTPLYGCRTELTRSRSNSRYDTCLKHLCSVEHSHYSWRPPTPAASAPLERIMAGSSPITTAQYKSAFYQAVRAADRVQTLEGGFCLEANARSAAPMSYGSGVKVFE